MRFRFYHKQSRAKILLSGVYAPIGLDLSGSSPEEIAVEILVDVISVRRGGSGGSRSRYSG